MKKVDRNKLENIIKEELEQEQALSGGNIAYMISKMADKLISSWRETKTGVSDYVLDQASQDLKKSILISFSSINKKVDRGGYSDVSKQRETEQGKFAAGSLEELLYNTLKTSIEEVVNSSSKPNPWAVCTDSVGRKDKSKYERCVKKVKKQHGEK